MGSFDTELELCAQGSMQRAFVHARLMRDTSDHEVIKQEVQILVQRYIEEQLRHYPIGTRALGREITTAYKMLLAFFVDDELHSEGMPSALYTQLRDEAGKEVTDCVNARKENMVKNYVNRLRHIYGDSIPMAESFLNATRQASINFNLLSLHHPSCQSEESIKEHKEGYRKVMDAVQHYQEATSARTKSVMFVGAGGVAKTEDMRLAGLYAISKGLFVISTTLTGKRAAELTGEHLHLLFGLPTNGTLSAGQLAEIAYRHLLANPLRLYILQIVDVILLDEFGQCDTKLLEVLNILMKRIRRSCHFMGGVLVFFTIDGLQLQPVDGISPIFSPFMMCTMTYVPLNIPLRTLDVNLRKIQAITRMTKTELYSEGVKEEFFKLITENCNFLTGMDDPSMPTGSEVVFCFPKHDGCIKAEKAVLCQVKNSGIQHTTRVADDWEETRTQINPTPASASTVHFLDRKADTSKELVFYENGCYTISYNDKGGKFFHGQLCLVNGTVPSQQQVDNWEEVEVWRAPHGTDMVPSSTVTPELLAREGWEKVRIGKHPEYKQNIGMNGSVAWREQYGLKNRIAATIHAIMGCTVGKLVTKMDDLDGNLWEAAMVVVLLSRTCLASDLYFMGERQKVVDILWQTLLKAGSFGDLCQHIMDCLIQKNQQDPYQSVLTIPRTAHFLPEEQTIPGEGNHVVYMLISLKDGQSTYIGHTANLRYRINQHNSSLGGSRGTGGDHRLLAPWGLFSYVAGFPDRQCSASFEGQWKLKVGNAQNAVQGSLDPQQKAMLAPTGGFEDLHIRICGKLERR